MDKLGTRIKEIRESKNMSLYELARITGVSNCHLWRIENNKRKDPSISTIIKIANALDVSLEEITGQYKEGIIKINTSRILDSIVMIDNFILSQKQKEQLCEFLINI